MTTKTIVTALLVLITLLIPLSLYSQSQDFEMNGTVLVKYNGSAARVTIPSGVTAIGNNAFINKGNLTSITIPSSVTSIGSYAFQRCSSLTSITIPSSVISIGVSAFIGCTSLTSITIPSSVISIGGSAFADCTSLASITIPASVTSIGGGAFDGTAWLDSQPDGLVYVGKVLYTYKGTMPTNTVINNIRADTVAIAGGAFFQCTSLTSITIPSGITSIESGVFSECRSLTSITIPSSVTSIGDYAFRACTSLTSITIPLGVTSVGVNAFADCRSLTSITIPSSVTSIGAAAFSGCTSLTSVTIPSSVTSMEHAFHPNVRIIDSLLSGTTWRGSDSEGIMVLMFNRPNYTMTFKGSTYSGRYTLSGSIVTLYFGFGEEGSSGTLAGNTLTLEDSGGDKIRLTKQ